MGFADRTGLGVCALKVSNRTDRASRLLKDLGMDHGGMRSVTMLADIWGYTGLGNWVGN